jgi:ankyrin repeat protein
MPRVSELFQSKPLVELAEASAKGRVEKIQLLIKNGVNLNSQGKDGITVLFWALLHKNKKSIEVLLQNGADPNVRMTDGESPMSFAAMSSDSWYLESFLKHGGNPNLLQTKREYSPLFSFIETRGLNAVSRMGLTNARLLVAAGADVNFRNRNGETPLQYAVYLWQYDMAYFLLQEGADVTLQDNTGHTCLSDIEKERMMNSQSEQYRWRVKVIELLRSKGVVVNPY